MIVPVTAAYLTDFLDQFDAAVAQKKIAKIVRDRRYSGLGTSVVSLMMPADMLQFVSCLFYRLGPRVRLSYANVKE